MENPNRQIDALKERLSRLKSEISISRKAGHDTSIAELLIMNIPSKIQMAIVTGESTDIVKVSMLIDAAKKEIDSIVKEKL